MHHKHLRHTLNKTSITNIPEKKSIHHQHQHWMLFGRCFIFCLMVNDLHSQQRKKNQGFSKYMCHHSILRFFSLHIIIIIIIRDVRSIDNQFCRNKQNKIVDSYCFRELCPLFWMVSKTEKLIVFVKLKWLNDFLFLLGCSPKKKKGSMLRNWMNENIIVQINHNQIVMLQIIFHSFILFGQTIKRPSSSSSSLSMFKQQQQSINRDRHWNFK